MLLYQRREGVRRRHQHAQDQVVSAPPLAVAACPKPRQLALVRDMAGGRRDRLRSLRAARQLRRGRKRARHRLFRATLQSPQSRSTTITATDSLQIRGKGLTADIRVEILSADSTGCLTFEQAAKIKKMGKKFLLKGPLSDGRRLSEVIGQGSFVILRITLPDGTTRIVIPLADCGS